MYALNEKVVYPAHGVAQVNRIVKKTIAGVPTYFYELVFLHQDMTILVPVDTAETIGLRPLSTDEHINSIFHFLAEPQPPMVPDALIINWNKRNKEYKERLQTGDIAKISAIYRYLMHLGTQKDLSFGEKELLKQTELLLAEEIAEVRGIQEDVALLNMRKAVLPYSPYYTK
jgi:CarD family transcriptional regulator